MWSQAHAVCGNRRIESIGAVTIGGLKGEARANAMMKPKRRPKRRVTLSICGLGWSMNPRLIPFWCDEEPSLMIAGKSLDRMEGSREAQSEVLKRKMAELNAPPEPPPLMPPYPPPEVRPTFRRQLPHCGRR